jgi:hypothetical protein
MKINNGKFLYHILFGLLISFFIISNVTAEVIKDDFMVNEEDYPATFNQHDPGVARDSAGNFIVVWEDDRDGNVDIRGQMYLPDGTPAVNGFKVNDDNTLERQVNPEVACDSDGNFVVVWEDNRNSTDFVYQHDVYAQRFDNKGNHLGGNFCPVDPPSAMVADQWKARVGMGNDGAFVIAWMDQRNGENEIYAQRYDASGVPQDTNFRANDGSGNASIPAVAVAPSGKFVITWYDARKGDYDIWAQFYEATGETTLAYNIIINFPLLNAGRYYPDVCYDGRNFPTFTWQDYRNSDTTGYISDIYATRYDADLHKLTALDFIVDNDTILDSLLCDHQWFPRIAASQGRNNFIIAWGDKRDGDQDIYARFYDSTGVALGENFRIDDGPGTTCAYFPDLDVDYRGNSVFTWEDNRLFHWDIRGRLYDTLANALGPSIVLNDDSVGAYQYESDLAYGDGNEWWMIAWADERNVHGDIYGQRIDTLGNLLGPNFRINDDATIEDQLSPRAAMTPDGRTVVAWLDNRRGTTFPDIYAQRFDGAGSPVGSNFRINGANMSTNANIISLDVNRTGRFCIGWKDSLHFYDANGNLESTAKITVPIMYWPSIGDIATNNDGDFIVGICIDPPPPSLEDSFYIQRFDSIGNEIGSRHALVLPGILPLNNVRFQIASDSAGNVALVWEDWLQSGEGNDILARKYDSIGNPISDTIMVNDNTYHHHCKPYIDMDKNGAFIIGWQDYREGPQAEIYAQKFQTDGTRDGGNYRISNTSLKYQGEPTVDIADSLILYSWSDSRHPEHGNDIFAKIIGRGPTAIGLTSFFAESVSKGIKLMWRMESESNISCFIVSKLGKDGIYREITTIQGQGTSPKPTSYNHTDKDVIQGSHYSYRLIAINKQGQKKEYGPICCTYRGIKKLALTLLSSNPSKGSILFSCHIPKKQKIKLSIRDVSGRTVTTLADTVLKAGKHRFTWDTKSRHGHSVSSGVYFIVMESRNRKLIRKLLFIP